VLPEVSGAEKSVGEVLFRGELRIVKLEASAWTSRYKSCGFICINVNACIILFHPTED
jgi:hypothetical protein